MESTNPFVPVSPNELHARVTQELNKLHAISVMIDTILENIDHTRITIPPIASFEQLLNDFMNLLDVFKMDDLESDDESIDTPLVSPFSDSDDKLGDGEVLNELDKYGNAEIFYRNKIINSIDGDELAFPCMIGFRKFVAYFDPFLSMNIITCKAYNTIMVEGLENTEKNLVAIVRDVYVFVGSFTYVTDFVVLDDIGEFIVSDMSEIVMGRPSRAITQLEYDYVKGLIYLLGYLTPTSFGFPTRYLGLKTFHGVRSYLYFTKNFESAIFAVVVVNYQRRKHNEEGYQSIAS
nr:hypothetical protein [Tanacetum cinerariifolium]